MLIQVRRISEKSMGQQGMGFEAGGKGRKEGVDLIKCINDITVITVYEAPSQ